MENNYKEEIEKHKEAIRLLEDQELKANAPDYSQYIGLCFMLSGTSLVKIIKVHDIGKDNTIYCQMIRVYISDMDENITSIDTNYEDYIDAYTINYLKETPEKFNKKFEKALEIIKKVNYGK